MCDYFFSIGLVLTGIEICFYIVSLFIVGGSLKNVIGTVIAVVCLVVEFLGIHDKRLDFVSFSVGFRCIKFGFSTFLIIYIFEGNVPRYRSYGRNTMFAIWIALIIDIIYNGFRVLLQTCIYKIIKNGNETSSERRNVGESSSVNATHIQMQPIHAN